MAVSENCVDNLTVLQLVNLRELDPVARYRVDEFRNGLILHDAWNISISITNTWMAVGIQVWNRSPHCLNKVEF